MRKYINKWKFAMDVSEILSVFSIVISRFFSNIHSFFLLFILKLRGMKGGRGLRIHSTVTMCDWLCNMRVGRNVVLHRGVRIVMSRGSSLELKNKAWISYYTIIIAGQRKDIRHSWIHCQKYVSCRPGSKIRCR